jgi:hypothetical protein
MMTAITAESLIDTLDAVLSEPDDAAFNRKTDDLLDLGDTLEPAEQERFYELLDERIDRLRDRIEARRRMAEDLP